MATDILMRCAEKKSELDSLRPLNPEQEARVLQKLRLEWDFHSNHLEGNSLSYGETRALILHGLTAQGKPLKDHFEITGHHEAVLWLEELVAKKEPLTENVIRQLHKLILKEDHQIDALTSDGNRTTLTVEVGRYKTQPNHVKTATGETVFFSTPTDTPIHMNELVAWFSSVSTSGPIERAAEFHHRLTRIHPFTDGNGRIARLVSNFVLMMAGYPPVIVKSREKASYFAALAKADAGDMAAFTAYLGERLLESLDLMIRGARGEDVDEPGDVDKQLALVIQRFESSKDRVNVLRNNERSQAAWSAWIRPLLERFIGSSDKFLKLYLSREISIQVGNRRSAGPVEDEFTFALQKIGSTRELAAHINFNNVRTRDKVGQAFAAAIIVTLYDTHAEVLDAGRRKLADVDWDQLPTPTNLSFWIEREEKRHVDHLEKLFPRSG